MPVAGHRLWREENRVAAGGEVVERRAVGRAAAPVRVSQPRRPGLRRPRKPPAAATARRPVACMAAGAGGGSLATGAVRLAGGPAIERSTAEPGPAAAACGVTPARRITARTPAACAGARPVAPGPAGPARAVRPA